MVAFVVVAVIAFMVTVAVTVMVAALVAAEPAVAAVALVVVFTRALITFMFMFVIVAMLVFMATVGQGGPRGAEQDEHQSKDEIKETLSHVFPPDIGMNAFNINPYCGTTGCPHCRLLDAPTQSLLLFDIGTINLRL